MTDRGFISNKDIDRFVTAEQLRAGHEAWLAARLARLKEVCPDASPYFNLYSPTLDPPCDSGRSPKGENGEAG